jgi:uncharacterized beta-barrel protein YwiB (DUF1934 family)
MRIPFQKNKTATGSYETPYGILELSTATSKIDHSFDEESNMGEFNFLYRLNMQGSDTGTYQLTIRFEEDHS